MSSSEDNNSRRLSNSSMANDISFLPRYEAGNMYHLQSDLDISTSEVEDNVSTTPSQLGDLSKEQICSAFQKSQMRYQKYRGRYTDLAKHYKDLERENEKMKSVLLETQDKAVRKVTELREQCGLEQKSKVSLESALRDEIDERNYKIESLQTKIEILHNDNGSSSSRIETKETDSQSSLKKLTKYLNEARKEIEVLNEKIQELKANSIVYQSKEQEHKSIICHLEEEMQYAERGKENNLKFAENKMELQEEIEHLNELAQKKEEENVYLSNENMNLERVLTNVNGKLRLLEEKYEAVGLDSSENKLLELKLQKLEEENNNLQGEFEMERKMFNDMLEDHNELIEKERHLELLKNELKGRHDKVILLKQLLAEEKKNNIKLDNKKLQLEKKIHVLIKKIRILEEKDETEHMDKAECGILEMKLKKLENENQALLLSFEQEREVFERDILSLRQELPNPEQSQKSVNEKHLLTDIQILNTEKEKEIVYLSEENSKLQQTNSKLSKKLKLLQCKYETVHVDSNECRLLELKLKKEEEVNNRLKAEFEMERKVFNDLLKNLKKIDEQDRFIEKLEHKLRELHVEIKDLKDNLKIEKEKNIQLEHKKITLENEILKMEEHNKILEEKDESLDMDRTEYHLIKMKLRGSEKEKENLLQMFEEERIVFDKVYKEKSVQEKEVKHLLSEIKDMKEQHTEKEQDEI